MAQTNLSVGILTIANKPSLSIKDTAHKLHVDVAEIGRALNEIPVGGGALEKIPKFQNGTAAIEITTVDISLKILHLTADPTL